ncbi:MAG: GntR family transcriptional regulator [Bacteroidales bacterium]|nr:GntR family transcriptional regulator [Bacteroidales bacterium]
MIKSILNVSSDSPQTKYKQIVQSVLESINEGRLKIGDKMPSINDVCKEYSLSRDTVLIAYNELKARGIISSKPGKGYYVETNNVEIQHKVFVLFDELNSFKEDLYNAFLQALGEKVLVDIYFHHFNRKVFETLISENNGHYTTYVIMPAKFTDTAPILEQISGRVIILDQLPTDLSKPYPAIYQNFAKDSYNALMAGRHLLTKYRKLIMVYPGGKEPEGQFKGYLRYCEETNTPFELISDLRDRQISQGEAYIAIWDRDLVKLVTEAQNQELEIGKDIGIISYNDTALKQIAANGITTISTDFKDMGQKLAELIKSKKNEQIENLSSLIIRKSL